MFKNKFKYSLLIGSSYNVKCDFTFKAYVDGEELAYKKTLNFGKITEYKEKGINIKGVNMKSFNKMLEEDSEYDFADYIQKIVFYPIKEYGGAHTPLAGKKFVKAKFDGSETEVDFKGFEKYKDDKITVNFYYFTRVEYKIINEDEILKLKGYYDSEKWKEIKNSLEIFSKRNVRLTYDEIKNRLKWFTVEIFNKDINMYQSIALLKSDSYITEDESKKIKLLEDKKNRIPKKIKIFFNDSKEIEIKSYKGIKIKDLCDIYEDSDCSFALKNGYFKFYDKSNGKELKDEDLVQDNMSCENIKYEVAIYKIDKNEKKNIIKEYSVVDDLKATINYYKAKTEYKDYKFEVYRGYKNGSYDAEKDSYKNYLDYKVVIVIREQGENPKADEYKAEESKEKPIETHIDKSTGKNLTDGPKVDDPKKDNLTIDNPKKDDSKVGKPTGDKPTDVPEAVKKTALIKQCKDLVNEIEALDSSYDKTINESDSVENLETLKTELTNKLDELKNKKPKDKEVQENSNPKNTEPTGTNGGNTEKNKNKCGNCCCKNKK